MPCGTRTVYFVMHVTIAALLPPTRPAPAVVLLVLVCSVILAGCGGSPGGSRSLTIAPASLELAVGASSTLTASVAGVPASGVTWSSAAPAVAQVAANGVVTAVSPGSTQVTATLVDDPGVRGTIRVTVLAASAGPAALVSMDGGLTHTVALGDDGAVWSWGANLLGQFGSGGLQPSQSSNPVRALIDDVVGIAAGDHFSVAVRSDGTVWAWGSNGSGQVGPGAEGDWQTTPVQVSGITDAVAVAAVASTAVALLTDGTVMAWGSNANGALGRGTFTPTEDATPALVVDVSGATAVALGGGISQAHGLALLGDGTVMAWGSNALAALGQPVSTPASATPVTVAGVTGVESIGAGQGFSLVVTGTGDVYGWGAANVGQLGAGTVGAYSQTPVKADVEDVTALAAGHLHVVALHDDGTLSTWGSNSFGQLGIGADSGFRLSPQRLGVTGFGGVAAGMQFSFGIEAGGVPWGWGNNLNLQVGREQGSVTTAPSAIW